MAFNQKDIQNLLSVLRAGRRNAKTASRIENELNRNFRFVISGNQVKTRGLITYAIQHGHLIKSSTSNPRGYWLENDPVEIEKYISSLKKRASKISQRAKNLKANLQ